MPNIKFYAVCVGRKTGIFNTWSECEKQVKGYSGASYSSFVSREEAEQFLNDFKLSQNEEISNSFLNADEERSISAYVDGSYDENIKKYSCGVVMFFNGEKVTLFKNGNNPDLVQMRNVAGEIMGSMIAMQYAMDNKDKISKLKIYHDYEGIAKWCTGEWKANKQGTIEYKNFYNKISKIIKVTFIKVQAHSGNKYNEEADKLAKYALYNLTNETIEPSSPKNTETKKTKSSGKLNIYINYQNKDTKIEDVIKNIKTLWRKSSPGRKISDIKNLNIYIDILTYKYFWEIETQHGIDKGELPL